jgi:hypothetical protein
MNKVSSVELEGFSNHGEIEVGERVCRVRQLSKSRRIPSKRKIIAKDDAITVTCLILYSPMRETSWKERLGATVSS